MTLTATIRPDDYTNPFTPQRCDVSSWANTVSEWDVNLIAKTA